MLPNDAHGRPPAFIVMPFNDVHDGLYPAITDAVEASGLAAVRADEISRSAPALDNVFAAIDQAALVIGVTSGANFNVGLELGYARGHNTESILLTDDPESLPFDVRHINHLVYDCKDLEGLSDSLGKWIAGSDYAHEAARRQILYRGDILENVPAGQDLDRKSTRL